MNVETYLEAKELYDKYSLCESILEYLSDEDLPQGQKYLETLKMFVNVFPNDFMMFVHNKMQEIGAMFEELHCPEHSESGLQPPILPPTEEPTRKFKDGDIVKILSGESEGKLAKIVYCDDSDNSYRVEFLDDGATGSLWYQEDELELYTEPENPEEDGGTTAPYAGE